MNEKKYFIFNEEPNTNILSLDSMVQALLMPKIHKFTGKGFSEVIFELDNGKFRAGVLIKEATDFANHGFTKLQNDPAFEAKMVKKIKQDAQKIYKFCLSILKRLKSNKVSDSDKKKTCKKVFSLYIDICVYGLIGPMIELSTGGLSKKLDAIFKSKTKDAKKLSELTSYLTFRFIKNYDYLGYKDLVKIAQKIWLDKKLKDLFNSQDGEEIKMQLPKNIRTKIEKYLAKWGWLTYSYCGPAYNFGNAINDLKSMLALSIPPGEQLHRLNKEMEFSRCKQRLLAREIKFNKKEAYLIKVAGDFTETKVLRAKMIFLANFTIYNLLDSFIIKEGISFKQLGVCTIAEIMNYFNTGKFPAADILNDRLKYALLLSKRASEKILVGNSAKKWFANNVKIEEFSLDMSEISGQIACRGNGGIVKGRVKIINVFEDMAKFADGDILVSIATTPEIVPVMKKAAAIITDNGGLTCHAAIVSRELSKPCIIGTKIATKVLQDNDLVELDMDRGIIRRA